VLHFFCDTLVAFFRLNLRRFALEGDSQGRRQLLGQILHILNALPKESRDGIEFPLVLRQDGVWHVVQLDDAVGRPILTLEGADHHIANLFN
jgi:hypothetical protein